MCPDPLGLVSMFSTMTKEDVLQLQEQYGFPSQFQVSTPRPDDRVTLGLMGGITLYEKFLYAGLRLSFYPFIRNVLDFYRPVPIQFTPKFFCIICSFIILCHFFGIEARVSLL